MRTIIVISNSSIGKLHTSDILDVLISRREQDTLVLQATNENSSERYITKLTSPSGNGRLKAIIGIPFINPSDIGTMIPKIKAKSEIAVFRVSFTLIDRSGFRAGATAPVVEEPLFECFQQFSSILVQVRDHSPVLPSPWKAKIIFHGFIIVLHDCGFVESVHENDFMIIFVPSLPGGAVQTGANFFGLGPLRIFQVGQGGHVKKGALSVTHFNKQFYRVIPKVAEFPSMASSYRGGLRGGPCPAFSV